MRALLKSSIKGVLVLSILGILCVTFFYDSFTLEPSSGILTKEVASGYKYAVQKKCKGKGASCLYPQGKQIVYKPLNECKRPKFLKNYTNPCWVPTYTSAKLACAPKIILLGVHKSGTTDLSDWFSHHPESIATVEDFYKTSTKSLTADCPIKWIEESNRASVYLNDTKKTAYNDCPGCILVSRVIQENETHLIRQSAIQYLQLTMVKETRYIITLRNPVERYISQFFYLHKIQRMPKKFDNYTIKDLGNGFFHKLVESSLESLKSCLWKYGPSQCIVEPKTAPVVYESLPVIMMLCQSCYVSRIKEILKFIPKSKIYFSRMEDYSKMEVESIRKIYEFVGLPTDGKNNPDKVASSKNTKNVGSTSKPVLTETKVALKKFFDPFNVDLAVLLEDEKWLWK